MATLSLSDIRPKDRMDEGCLPLAVRAALKHVFVNAAEGLWLVGGSALAGFYAGHRCSDDLDMFAAGSESYKAAVLAVKSLKNREAVFLSESGSSFYYHAEIDFFESRFAVDVVVDERLPQIGRAMRTGEGIWVADLPTLFKMKAAALLSRCAEKDLFDLDWFFSQHHELDARLLIEAGSEIDAGLNAQTLLISLQGAALRKEACHFLLPHSPLTVDEAFRKIKRLRGRLVDAILEYERGLPSTEEVAALAQAFKDQKKLK